MTEYSVDKTIQQLEAAMQAGLVDIGKKIEADAKSMAPVRTGKLRDSIHAEVGNNEVTVGSNLVYAPIQEVRKHFLEQAIDKNSTYILNIMADKLK